MSHYPDADEAQRHHYNDGYPIHTPYGAGTPLADPFNPAHNPYASPPPHNSYASPPPHNPYASPPPPPPVLYGAPGQNTNPYHPTSTPLHPMSPPPMLHAHSPPPPGGMVGYAPPAPAPTPGSLYTRSGYDLHDGGEEMEDTGDIPLLRRDPSSMSSIPHPPGAYDDDEGDRGTIADDRSENNIRYGRIPQRVPRRYKTIKKVELFHGNFVLDNAVPKKLLDMCPNRTDREFTHMRYSAATCDPNDFKDSGFTLRQVHYDPPRRTELFIVMTMYNEDEELFCRTMHGVIKNIAHLCKRDRSKTWGKDGWKKVVVCIVSDGRSKINSRTLSVIAAMGAYQEGVAKTKIGKQDVTAHIYESFGAIVAR
ncbi:chitin synthase-domain-containing protein [Pholiota molesta]|nr:chitin synthase-domain-containing protein [Pholiota molesta]